MTSTTIVWICSILLIAIFIIAMIGIFRANKANREAMSIERVACAGSVDNSYPATVKIKLPDDPAKNNGNISKEEMKSLSRFIVKGNSMQYADISPNDLVYVKKIDVDSLRHELPKITLLSFKTKSPGMSDMKIRRTWSVIKTNISDEEFNSVLDSILNTKQFDKLRTNVGDKCPSNDKLKQIAFDRLHSYRTSFPEALVEDILLSTTFRTEQDRIEFSIHPSSSLQGVVAYVSHPIGRTSA